MTHQKPPSAPAAPDGPLQLTLAQKASLTSGAGDFVTETVPGVPTVSLSDGPHGLRLPRGQGDGGQIDLHSAAPATCFPPAVALGSSWDPGLAARVAAAIATEARAHGVQVVLGPGINIKRSPLCGRNFEYFSEDPFLTAEMGGAMVRGLQEAGVGAALKHYAANNQETDRMRISADIDERPLREIYLRAFERIVRRDRPWSVMASYNALNGVPVSENHRLLTGILRTEWGFDGVVMSDWGAVRDRVAALHAGLDLQMPGTGGRTDREVVAAVECGALEAEVLDRSVERLARFARRANASVGRERGEIPYEAHHLLAREAAERCLVLLKNDTALLPLDPGAGRIAVIGELARTPRFQGAGSSQVTPTRLDLPLDSLRAAADGARVEFAPGYALPDGGGHPAGHQEAGNAEPAAGDSATGDPATVGPPAEGPAVGDPAAGAPAAGDPGTGEPAAECPATGDPVAGDPATECPATGDPAAALALEAERLAARSDTVLLFLGLPAQDESEGFDRDHIDLPEAQLRLLERVVSVNPRVAVVLSNGGVVRTAPWHDRVPALVEGWLLGQAGGAALARILFGAAGPSGRLAETVPLRLEDSPTYLSFPGDEGHVRYGEGVFVGYRGYDARRSEVAFPFGHGLSYTSFDYSGLTVETGPDGARLTVRVGVTNTGRRAGREIVQIYSAGPEESATLRPERELRGFTAVDLEPGEHREVRVELDRAGLAHYSEREGGWRVAGGTYRIEAAASSRDIRLAVRVTVDGDPSRIRLTGRHTLAEWFAHPVGGPLLLERFARGGGAPGGSTALADPVMRRFLAGIPLDVIADSPQSPVSPQDLKDLAARAAAETPAPEGPGAG
ncbi:glycoside hydrolase family 3 C-terminal domain-containing protein [Streptomyces sp. NPDC059398]|uniref:glycoside hydrolase family 3 C-terminal domain-containing protein n=1 Tax=Streptomyces sp. NPDC059398 TaxID=3346820 RepID=UPI0036BEAEA6